MQLKHALGLINKAIIRGKKFFMSLLVKVRSKCLRLWTLVLKELMPEYMMSLIHLIQFLKKKSHGIISAINYLQFYWCCLLNIYLGGGIVWELIAEVGAFIF